MIARILKISSGQSILKRRRRMYKNVIDVRKDALQDILHALAEAADRAFDNRAGKIENTSDTPYRFIYIGGESLFCCLQLGMLALEKNTEFCLI
ncbi:hypothetical protein GCWU000342_00145 [Shuttleworthella satelles DSM 14600]|uniref:Uncharacterized protein n=2 Tax=Shuttleworthella TaxID=177971 RepID=C4G850_9FIRM|nr:hypothetical protein GCWU000342_00145 [Shuttleworthia satelles DSM 14600]